MSICRNCGKEHDDSFPFCGYCGAPVEKIEEKIAPISEEISDNDDETQEPDQMTSSNYTKALFCRKCGERLDETDEFCGYCGAKVERREKAAEPVKTKKRKKIAPAEQDEIDKEDISQESIAQDDSSFEDENLPEGKNNHSLGLIFAVIFFGVSLLFCVVCLILYVLNNPDILSAIFPN